jgi:predicted amidophosphoribosyltransferase
LKNCFEWSGKSLSNKKIIIIDDVCTTGATLNEIAMELKKHQAQEIWGLVLAHG